MPRYAIEHYSPDHSCMHVRILATADVPNYYQETRELIADEADAIRLWEEATHPTDRNGSAIQLWNSGRQQERTRTVTNGIGAPCTFAGSFKRQLQAWANAGSELATYLLNPDNTHNGEIDYLAARDGTISYLPAGKTHVVNADGTWSRQNRQDGKAGRVIQKILVPWIRAQISDADLETFGNHCKTASDDPPRIAIVDGDDIAAWYSEERYARGCTSLQKSCMRDMPTEVFELYARNPQVCRMAILTNEHDQLEARALIWQTTDGITLMDRVYGEDWHVQLFHAYAKAQGWHVKTHQTYDAKTNITDPDGHRSYEWVSVQLTHTPREYFPYVDTFTYLDPDDGILTNTAPDEDTRYYTLESTSGGYNEHEPYAFAHCDSCGDALDEDDTYYSPGGTPYCHECWSDRYTDCAACGDTVSQHRAHNGPDDNSYCWTCFNDHFADCEDCDRTHDRDDLDTYTDARGNEYVLCPDCLRDREEQDRAGEEDEDEPTATAAD